MPHQMDGSFANQVLRRKIPPYTRLRPGLCPRLFSENRKPIMHCRVEVALPKKLDEEVALEMVKALVA